MSSPSSGSIVLQTRKAAHQISRHLYGHFAEHLGSCIYGGFFVGEKSPVANVNGIRLDVVEALKKIRIPNLRWPGGCFADSYQWRDGIGPREKRPSIVNTWWGGVTEDNSFGTHDFLNLCELLGAEPFISGNVGSGTVRQLMDWVQYVNFDGVSPMSVLRMQNGRAQPWHVKYWGIGNESWGCGGNMRAEYYADVYRQYATFMTDWSNTTGVFRIASGAQSGDYHWTEVLMKTIPHHLIEGVGLHHYSVIDWNNKGPSTNFSLQQYFDTMRSAVLMDDLIKEHGAVMDRYDPAKKIALVVDEWGGWYDPEPGTNPGFLYQQNTMRDAMIAAVTLNIFNAHADRVRMANLAQAVNVLQCVLFAKDDKMVLTPTYHVMEMFTPHQDSWAIPIEIITPVYSHGQDSLPALSASASLQDESAHITICNIDPGKEHAVSLNADVSLKNLSARILTSPSVQDFNYFDDPHRVVPKDFDVRVRSDGPITFLIPPCSVISISCQVEA